MLFKGNETDELYDPVGWCTDMASTNVLGIKDVYGEEGVKKMKGCGFHYSQSVERQMKQLEEPQRSNFYNFSQLLHRSATTAAYKATYTEIKEYLTANQMELQLKWLKWWDDHKFLMFDAFSIDGPQSNLAEVIHAGWKNSGAINMSLLRCAKEDMLYSRQLITWFNDIKSGMLFCFVNG